MKTRVFICDLDNTLYDWVAYFVPSFYAMIDVAVTLLNCDREALLDDLRLVHQRHHDSEHPFAILETEIVQKKFAGLSREKIAHELDPALHAFNSARRTHLKLHSGVDTTLATIKLHGMRVIAHTESNLFAALDRVVRLNIAQFFDRIYCRERPKSVHPNYVAGQEWFTQNPLHKVVELSRHQMKPNAEVLLEICRKGGFDASSAVYIGDSMARDILMAKRAGVVAVWAAYGARHNPELYEKLVRITHWTKEDVEREKRLSSEANTIRPDYIANTSFGEVLQAITFDENPTRIQIQN